jgi:hypothetical protein
MNEASPKEVLLIKIEQISQQIAHFDLVRSNATDVAWRQSAADAAMAVVQVHLVARASWLLDAHASLFLIWL